MDYGLHCRHCYWTQSATSMFAITSLVIRCYLNHVLIVGRTGLAASVRKAQRHYECEEFLGVVVASNFAKGLSKPRTISHLELFRTSISSTAANKMLLSPFPISVTPSRTSSESVEVAISPTWSTYQSRSPSQPSSTPQHSSHCHRLYPPTTSSEASSHSS
jgi:hypothetical protein